MLFKPFAQADGTVTRRYGGTGLGLAISHDLAQRMGGSLELQTEMGKGSTFEFSLPFRPASPKELSILPEPPKGLRKVHILDTENVRLNIYVGFFNDLGVTTDVLSTSAEANVVLKRINDGKTGLDEILLINLDGNVSKDIFTFCETHQCSRLIVLYPPNDTSAANHKSMLQRPLLPTVLMRHIDQQLGNASVSALQVPPVESEQDLPLNGLTVLAVDDNELNRVVIEACLKRGGAAVRLASSGPEAIEMVSQHQFDVVLMDIQMPDMDGYETGRQIRASGHDIPIVALTAHALIQDKERSSLEGMVDHLSKPVSRQELYAVLSQFVPSRSPSKDDQPPL
jgi:CheY-like chemotaxis protein